MIVVVLFCVLLYFLFFVLDITKAQMSIWASCIGRLAMSYFRMDEPHYHRR